MSSNIPDNLSRSHLIRAFDALDSGIEHAFAESTKYDVVHDGKRYPPKAVVGLASSYIIGKPLTPNDFSAGIGSKCFRVLEKNGFPIIPKVGESLYPDEVPYAPGTEGKRLQVYVNKYERDPALRDKCIAYFGPVCQVCEVDLADTYGDDLGGGFVHVHHRNPLAEAKERETDPRRDLVPVCPNCHAMLHRRDPPLSIETLREIVSTRRRS